MANIHHSINYIEFTVIDLEKSKAFFSKAFDWQFNDYSPGYAGIKNENGEIGGFSVGTTIKNGGPLVILYSSNLKLSLKNVIEAGGQITTETFAFPGGFRFHFNDPSGNELAVWSETN